MKIPGVAGVVQRHYEQFSLLLSPLKQFTLPQTFRAKRCPFQFRVQLEQELGCTMASLPPAPEITQHPCFTLTAGSPSVAKPELSLSGFFEATCVCALLLLRIR